MEVAEFVEAAIADLRASELLSAPDPRMPEEMRDDSRDSDNDWHPWKPIPSKVTDQDIGDVQSHFDCTLPGGYIALLKYVHFYELTQVGVGFAPHVVGRWKEGLIKLYDTYHPLFPERSHLIPFGRETFMDAGPVCFDANRPLHGSDLPVVYWDHDARGGSSEIREIFSSSQKMFECLHFVATADIGFVNHDPEYDSQDELPRKRQLLEQFLSIDPDGAGGPGRDYWTSWGVTLISAT